MQTRMLQVKVKREKPFPEMPLMVEHPGHVDAWSNKRRKTYATETKKVQLIYGKDPSKDVVECDTAQLIKHSMYLKGRLDAKRYQSLQIHIDTPETFIKYMVPHIETGAKIEIDDQIVFRLLRDAELLGMRTFLRDLEEYIGQNLMRLLSHKEFRCRWVSKESLLKVMQYRMVRQDMNGRPCKEFHLCVLFHWLADSDAEECAAMNVWFGNKLKCRRIESTENGFSDAKFMQLTKTDSVLTPFFTPDDMNQFADQGGAQWARSH